MALSNVYTGVHKGAMTLIGNTSMVNRDAINWNPFVFMSTIPTNQVVGYLGNTVSTTSTSYSTCKLNIPSTCTIKFATLTWTTNGAVANVKLIAPDGITTTIPATSSVTSAGNTTQSADVSNIIQSNKSGDYTVGNYGAINSYCGWSMLVIYEDIALPFRYFNAYLGIGLVNTTTPLPITFTNFVTPSSGPVKGYITLSYIAGDLGDAAQFKVGPTIPNNILGNTSTTIWNGIAPYNKSTNMFCGLICFADCNDPTRIGLINSESTLATRNINPYAGTYTASGRALYDITGLDMSSTLQNNQTNLYTSIGFLGGGGALSIIQAVQIDMNSADIIPVKSVDKATALPGDQLQYSLILKNTGLLNANNVLLVDTLPSGISFVSGSLKVNGVTILGGNVVPPGYTVGTVPFSSTTTVTFNAVVSTIPPVAPRALNNSYFMSYTFTPITTPQSSSAQSNIVNTTIPAGSLINIFKTVNKSNADILDYINYTVTIPNTGGALAGNIIFTDTIPGGTRFVSNSLVLNNVTIPGANPGTGVNIGTIVAGGISTINFSVQVVTVPTINPIPNSANTFYYSYGVTPVSNLSNTVYTQVTNGDLTLIKSCNKSTAKPLDTLTYTILLTNTGSVSSNNVSLIDTIPTGTTFIPNTVQVNGVTIPGISPITPVNVGTIAAGGNSIVTFMVTVDSPPSANPILNSATSYYSYTFDPSIPNGVNKVKNSNVVATNIVTLPLQNTIPNTGLVNFNYIVDPSTPVVITGTIPTPQADNFLNTVVISPLYKLVDKAFADVGYTLTYTVVVQNTGTTSANNVIFKDTIPTGTSFISNSLTINNSIVSGIPAPPTGVNIGTILAGGTSTITFKVTVITTPTINPVPNNANINYNYTLVPTNPNGASGTTITNTVTTQVNHVDIVTNKITTPIYVKCGDTISYTVTVKNTGNTTAFDVIVKDTIPNQTQFIANSFAVNGVTVIGENPSSGVNIGSVSAGGIVTITFQVRTVC